MSDQERKKKEKYKTLPSALGSITHGKIYFWGLSVDYPAWRPTTVSCIVLIYVYLFSAAKHAALSTELN